MTSSQNAATVLQMLDAAWNRGDTSVLDTTVAEDHIDHDDNGDDIGRDHLVQAILAYRAAFPDMRMSFDDQIADGDKVVTRWTANGTHQGQLDAIPATGRLARISGIFIHQLTDGEITQSWTSFDRLGLLQQLGVIPSADTAPASTPLPLPPAGSARRTETALLSRRPPHSPRACRRRKSQAQGARANTAGARHTQVAAGHQRRRTHRHPLDSYEAILRELTPGTAPEPGRADLAGAAAAAGGGARGGARPDRGRVLRGRAEPDVAVGAAPAGRGARRPRRWWRSWQIRTGGGTRS